MCLRCRESTKYSEDIPTRPDIVYFTQKVPADSRSCLFSTEKETIFIAEIYIAIYMYLTDHSRIIPIPDPNSKCFLGLSNQWYWSNKYFIDATVHYSKLLFYSFRYWWASSEWKIFATTVHSHDFFIPTCMSVCLSLCLNAIQSFNYKGYLSLSEQLSNDNQSQQGLHCYIACWYQWTYTRDGTDPT